MYGCEKINGQLETDDGLRRQVAAIREALYNGGRVTAADVGRSV